MEVVFGIEHVLLAGTWPMVHVKERMTGSYHRDTLADHVPNGDGFKTTMDPKVLAISCEGMA